MDSGEILTGMERELMSGFSDAQTSGAKKHYGHVESKSANDGEVLTRNGTTLTLSKQESITSRITIRHDVGRKQCMLNDLAAQWNAT